MNTNNKDKSQAQIQEENNTKQL